MACGPGHPELSKSNIWLVNYLHLHLQGPPIGTTAPAGSDPDCCLQRSSEGRLGASCAARRQSDSLIQTYTPAHMPGVDTHSWGTIALGLTNDNTGQTRCTITHVGECEWTRRRATECLPVSPSSMQRPQLEGTHGLSDTPLAP